MMYEHIRDHDLFPELSEAIATNVSGKRASHKATQLLSRGKTGYQLVGLIEGGDRVAFYEPIWRLVRSSPYTSNQVQEKRSRNKTVAESGQDGRDLLDTRGDLDWRHPRFRTN